MLLAHRKECRNGTSWALATVQWPRCPLSRAAGYSSSFGTVTAADSRRIGVSARETGCQAIAHLVANVPIWLQILANHNTYVLAAKSAEIMPIMVLYMQYALWAPMLVVWPILYTGWRCMHPVQLGVAFHCTWRLT